LSLALLLTGALSACSLPAGSARTDTSLIAGPGLGSFTFSGAAAVRDHPIPVFYIAPPGDLSTADILFVIPGHQRNAEAYRSDWEPLVAHRHVIVLVPQFDDDDYSDSSYNLGNLVNEDGEPNPRRDWTYTAIEALFDQVVADVHSTTTGFSMFGHSAGAQFVHRFVEFTPHNRVRAAVAANAGWYTLPDSSEDFPYGLGGSPLGESDMGAAFRTDLTVLLGADDIDSGDDSLRHDDGSDAQGSTRLERGLNFYLAARRAAADKSLDFRWSMQVVPGVDHDHTAMARAAAPFLLGTAGTAPANGRRPSE
jgi:hypothetical protein